MNNTICKKCLSSFYHLFTTKSNKFLGLCEPCNKELLKLKRKVYDLNTKSKQNENNCLLVNENTFLNVEINSSKKKLKSLQKSNESLNECLDLYLNRPRIASVIEVELAQVRDEASRNQKEADRLNNALIRSEQLVFYRHNLFRKPSLFSNVHNLGPGFGLFCRILIKKGHRFVYFVGDIELRPSGNVKDFYPERDVKYLLHLDDRTLLNCAQTRKMEFA